MTASCAQRAALFFRAFVLGVLGALAGCAGREAIPVYPDMTAARSLQLLAERARATRTISAQALVTLTRGNGQTVRLDAALVMRPPHRARLRAYKFGQAVFDITLTPDGVWLLGSQGSRRDETLSAGAQSADLTREWLRLLTGMFDEPGIKAEMSGPRLLVRETRGGGTTVVCEVQRKTLTVRRYALLDKSGRQRFTLALSDYSQSAGLVWPGRIEAISDSGRILIELHDVEINGDLPPRAFQPPARAQKLP